MAATPDTSNLTTSSQVFTTYTLPQIRAIHKSLHVQIDEKAARLRTQVGSSYRELLGTADTIVQMRGDMGGAQAILGRMGGACGRTVVEAKVAGLARFRGAPDADARQGHAARVRLLEAFALAISRLLKRDKKTTTAAAKTGVSIKKKLAGGKDGETEQLPESRGERLVLAAKTLVLTRLLISSFGDLSALDDELRAAVEAAKKGQRSLKNKLLRAVGKVLDRISDDIKQSDIVNALCAYSLVDSAGAKDVLRFFLNTRAEAIVLEFDAEEHERDKSAENVLRGLDLYTKTLLDVQALVPAKLTNALSSLTRKPLLADESLQSLEGLRLDIYGRWCGEEIQYYTPFVQQKDDLDGQQAKTMLKSWATKGGEILLEGLSKTLGKMTEFKAIIELRTNVLQHWIRDGGKARGFDPSVMLDGLRGAINKRLHDVLDTKVSKLRLIGSDVSGTLETWQSSTATAHKSLWDEDMLDMDLTAGATQVTHQILSRLYGKNDAVLRAVTSYESWYSLIDDVAEVAQQLRRQRWDNDIEEIEDEETIEDRQKLLSKEDPQKIEVQLNVALTQAYQNLDEQLGKLWQSHKDSTNNAEVAMYLLRIVRSIRNQLPKIDETKNFGLDSVPSLHEKLVAHVGVAPLEEFTSNALTRKRVAGRDLWEGEPALPSQPSPGLFSLLRNLIQSMGDAGLDLWSPTAIALLKQSFSAKLSDAWRAKLNGAEVVETKEEPAKPAAEDADSEDKTEKQDEYSPETEKQEQGEAAEEAEKSRKAESEQHKKDILIQWLYDIYLLQACLDTPGESESSLKKLGGEVSEKAEVSKAAQDYMFKMSQEYWKRTNLLFGLLA
jgi:conserved oligomeric Golgi complex subunit 1